MTNIVIRLTVCMSDVRGLGQKSPRSGGLSQTTLYPGKGNMGRFVVFENTSSTVGGVVGQYVGLTFMLCLPFVIQCEQDG